MKSLSNTRVWLAGLTAVLLLTSSITPVSVAVAQGNPAQTREWKAFADSPYGFCDASVLSQLWKVNTDEAKIRLGRMIIARNYSTLDRTLGQAYTQFGCQQGFNFQDAPSVAELWGA
ncbi:MAG: hypothetical protein NTV97_09410 [Alphaproteobacteria bacterium]|nr:hypothetical protein [Alphaproteobacteria bacterium]